MVYTWHQFTRKDLENSSN